MAEAISIKRQKSSVSDSSFDSQRREAIQLIEQVSGLRWTDYNLHDPGITILEQFIFAITDLIYRTEFAVEDYLTSADGSIDFKALALHPPEQVFSCRPCTELDYRKLLLDAVPVIDNVWLKAIFPESQQRGLQGLYRLLVKLPQGLDQQQSDHATEQLRRAYHRNRNLCEDIEDISIVENLAYELCANIEVSSARQPADILAQIYFECTQQLASSVTVTRFDELSERDLPFDELFDGPFTEHGIFLDENLPELQSEFMVSSLFASINAIDGVDHVQQLYLKKDQQDFYDLIESGDTNSAFSLQLPQSQDEIRVVLTTNGRVLDVELHDFFARFDEVNINYHKSRSSVQQLSLLYSPVEAVKRPLNRYYSIQNQFPANYAINALGVAQSASTAVKAKARQLKSYLLIFEQLLSNFLANLDSISSLFSTQSEVRETYSFQPLTEQQINDLQTLYPHNPFEVFPGIIARYDNNNNRKSRLLDYLLALYGESFTQNSLRHFKNIYAKNDIDEVIVNNKIRWLRLVVELGRDRAAADDYTAPLQGRHASSGLLTRVALLLGFEPRSERSFTMAILSQGKTLCHHHDYQRLKADSQELKLINPDQLDASSRNSFQPVFLQALEKDFSTAELRKSLSDIFPLKKGLLSDVLFTRGINIDSYRVGRLSSNEEYILTLLIDEDQYWYLASFDDRTSAASAANRLRQYLLRLNQKSEGLHIIEHILLRPSATHTHATIGFSEQDDFFSLQLSAIFPGWSVRCADEQFRMLAEETLRINLPAHIYPHIYWLDFAAMYEFETLYQRWLELKREPDSEPGELDSSAQSLIEFLLAHRQQSQSGG